MSIRRSKRSERIACRVTLEERLLLHRRARSEGITVSQLARRLVADGTSDGPRGGAK